MEVLLRHGADPNKKWPSRYGGRSNPIIIDVARNYAKHDPGQVCAMLRLLLAQGADVNVEEGNGLTALRGAVLDNHAKAVDILLQAGASTRKTQGGYGIWNKAPLVTAAGAGQVEIVKLLIEAGACVNPGAARRTAAAVANAAQQSNNNKPTEDSNEDDDDQNELDGGIMGVELPLHAAAKGGHLEVIRLLVAAGADVNRTNGWMKKTAILEAAEAGNVNVVKMMVEEMGVDLEMKDAPLYRGGCTVRQRLWDMDSQELHDILTQCGVTR
ncbi:ankyrin repeat-containing domain protein [Xylariales sp. PMI_506]|nr:ankyrin repeat-containing domain protein [Xylariales sp. PMI_506]